MTCQAICIRGGERGGGKGREGEGRKGKGSENERGDGRFLPI